MVKKMTLKQYATAKLDEEADNVADLLWKHSTQKFHQALNSIVEKYEKLAGSKENPCVLDLVNFEVVSGDINDSFSISTLETTKWSDPAEVILGRKLLYNDALAHGGFQEKCSQNQGCTKQPYSLRSSQKKKSGTKKYRTISCNASILKFNTNTAKKRNSSLQKKNAMFLFRSFYKGVNKTRNKRKISVSSSKISNSKLPVVILDKLTIATAITSEHLTATFFNGDDSELALPETTLSPGCSLSLFDQNKIAQNESTLQVDNSSKHHQQNSLKFSSSSKVNDGIEFARAKPGQMGKANIDNSENTLLSYCITPKLNVCESDDDFSNVEIILLGQHHQEKYNKENWCNLVISPAKPDVRREKKREFADDDLTRSHHSGSVHLSEALSNLTATAKQLKAICSPSCKRESMLESREACTIDSRRGLQQQRVRKKELCVPQNISEQKNVRNSKLKNNVCKPGTANTRVDLFDKCSLLSGKCNSRRLQNSKTMEEIHVRTTKLPKDMDLKESVSLGNLITKNSVKDCSRFYGSGQSKSKVHSDLSINNCDNTRPLPLTSCSFKMSQKCDRSWKASSKSSYKNSYSNSQINWITVGQET